MNKKIKAGKISKFGKKKMEIKVSGILKIWK
jgi:hypothetical protein